MRSAALNVKPLPDLRRRIEMLRDEIAQAEAKIPRTYEAIRTRKQTLSRLEAELVLRESRPAHLLCNG